MERGPAHDRDTSIRSAGAVRNDVNRPARPANWYAGALDTGAGDGRSPDRLQGYSGYLPRHRRQAGRNQGTQGRIEGGWCGCLLLREEGVENTLLYTLLFHPV